MEKNLKPKFITILGVKIKISYHKNLAKGRYLGLFWPDKKKIQLEDDGDVGAHLFHEATHAVIRLSGVKQKLGLTDEQEEELVSVLEEGLYPLYTLNPQELAER